MLFNITTHNDNAHNKKKNNLPVVVQRHAFLLTYKMIAQR